MDRDTQLAQLAYRVRVNRHPRGIVRLRIRARRINHHAIDRALHLAAWGPHVCRPFTVEVAPDGP
jgi:hypothetical protein